MTQATEMHLRHDLTYLRCIIAEAVRLHQRQTTKEPETLGVLHDYFSWLTVDAMTDERLTRRLHSITKLQEELYTEAENSRARDGDSTAPAFYEEFLHDPEQAISFERGADLLLEEEIDRG